MLQVCSFLSSSEKGKKLLLFTCCTWFDRNTSSRAVTSTRDECSWIPRQVCWIYWGRRCCSDLVSPASPGSSGSPIHRDARSRTVFGRRCRRWNCSNWSWNWCTAFLFLKKQIRKSISIDLSTRKNYRSRWFCFANAKKSLCVLDHLQTRELFNILSPLHGGLSPRVLLSLTRGANRVTKYFISDFSVTFRV